MYGMHHCMQTTYLVGIKYAHFGMNTMLGSFLHRVNTYVDVLEQFRYSSATRLVERLAEGFVCDLMWNRVEWGTVRIFRRFGDVPPSTSCTRKGRAEKVVRIGEHGGP